MRWFSSLRSLLVIAVGEWKRFVLTPSFITLAVIPPFVVLLYPSAYELISNTIQNWQTEQYASLRSAGDTHELTDDSIRFAVFDKSSWVHQRIKDKLRKTDLQVFLDALYNLDESEFATWARSAIDDINEVHPVGDRSFFQTNLIEFHRTLVDKEHIQKKAIELAERLENDENTNFAQLPTDSVLVFWKKIPDRIIELAPLVSFASFTEVDVEESSIDLLQSMLWLGEISGYFIIPSSVSENKDGLQLVVLHGTSKLVVEDLKNYYQSLLTAVVREKKLTEANQLIEYEYPRLTVYWSKTKLSDVTMDSNRIHYQGWGSPAKVGRFVLNHLPVIVSFIVLVCVTLSAPVSALSTLEERSSKLAETLLASIDAKLLLDAKVWGGMAGILSAMGCWLVFRVVYLLVVTPDIPFEILPNLQTVHLLHWTFFLVLAFAFYGYIFVAFGSVCNNQNDLVLILIPVFVFLSLAGLVVFELFENPTGLSASILSFFPPFTPFIMIGRTSNLPPWQIYLTISGLLLVSVIGVRQLGSVFFPRAFLIEQRPRSIKAIIRLARRRD